MGKITDAAIAIFVVIIGFFILARLGITLPAVETAIRHFFYPPSSAPANNTTAGIILGMGMTNSQMREKLQRKIDEIKRRLKLKGFVREEREARTHDRK